MDQGALLEKGNHDQLIALGGRYANYYKKQGVIWFVKKIAWLSG